MPLRRCLQACFFLVALAAWSQPMKSLEFKDQPIRDILLALGELNSVSIVPDETVDGTASYVFSNMDFNQALTTFLDVYKLSSVVKNGVYLVSRVSVAQNKDGSINVQATDVPLRSILKVLSSRLGKTILYDNIPNDPFTLNVQNASLPDTLGIVVAKYPDFAVVSKDQYFYLHNKTQTPPSSVPVTESGALSKAGDLYTFHVERARFKDLLLGLFGKASKEFVLLMDRDMIIENLYLKDLDFESALRALLLQANGDFKVDKGVYYIYEIQRKDLLKKYLTNLVVHFQYISSSDFLRLIPPNINSGNVFRLDDKGNEIILSGSFEEIKPILDFITLVDQPKQGSTTMRIDLKFAKTDAVLPLLPPDLAGFSPQPLPSKTSFIINLPDGKKDELMNFVNLIDQPTPDVPIHLRYMKADDLLAKLPPSVTDANIIKTNDQTLVFFKGSPALLQHFLKDLEQLDIPKPLLRYEILVLQFQQGSGTSLSSNMTFQSGADSKGFSGALGQLLNFNFDVIGNFGIGFGMNLNAAISNNGARVVADTTLNGISGEKISFQNTTSTYYAANEISTTGTATVVGSVNQLSSGLILGLEGWISSDNMVTLKVDATLSKQDASNSSTGTSSTASSGLPPNTDEKKLSTQVRMLSGQPLVIGGLKEDDHTISISKTPFLGDIPLLGLLFQNKTTQVTHTEFTIYIVPILDRPEEQTLSVSDRLMTYYQRFHSEWK